MIARRVRVALGIGATLAASVVVGIGPAAAATEDFTVAGTYEVTAPPGTTSATFDVDGAHGGAADAFDAPFSPGGQGGEVTISVAATAGTTFTLHVGGHGGDATTTSPASEAPTAVATAVRVIWTRWVSSPVAAVADRHRSTRARTPS